MSLGHHNKDTPRVELKSRGLAKNKQLTPIIAWLLKKAGIKVTVDGLEISETAGGLHLKNLGAGDAIKPFTCSISTGYKVSVAPGLFSGIRPKIGSAHLDDSPAPTLTISNTGDVFIMLQINATLTSAHDFVYTYEWGDINVVQHATIQTDDKSAGTYYLLLAKFTNGTKIAQYELSNLEGRIEDDGTASSQGDLYYVAYAS